jgi:hypothetical protein
MKRFIFLILIFHIVSIAKTQSVTVTDDSLYTPNTSSVLDVKSTNKGMLIPRVSLTGTSSASPITNPAASLLVYNIANISDVTFGYYYWNGTKWVRIANGEGRLNMVTKTTNAAITKTETMILASNDITLTLPIVTAEDNGLAITVKNIGTYTDLITIIGNGTATIDGMSYSSLTRWRVRTFIVSDGNWIIKDKEKCPENFLDVSEMSSWTSISEVIEFLNLHITAPTVVRLDGGTYTISATQNINLPFPVTFEGLSFGETTIAANAGVSGNPLFVCQTECYFKMINFTGLSNAAGNDAIHFTGSGIYHEVKDCYFSDFNKGIVSSTNNDLWIFETDFENCAGTGIEIAASSANGGSIKVSECDFTQCYKGINLLSGIAETVSILNCTFYNTIAGTDIGVNYTPATFTSFSSIFITNNAWNNQGNYISGFDFTRSDGRDANAFLVNNAGMENKNPFCKISVNNNASTTTITNSGTYYKASWTNAASSLSCKWTLANNKITYQPYNGRGACAVITGNISVNNANRVITICIVKNGVTTTRYGETDLRVTVASQPFQFSTVIYIPDIKKNDYLELWTTSANSGDVVTFQDIQWYTNTQ